MDTPPLVLLERSGLGSGVQSGAVTFCSHSLPVGVSRHLKCFKYANLGSTDDGCSSKPSCTPASNNPHPFTQCPTKSDSLGVGYHQDWYSITRNNTIVLFAEAEQTCLTILRAQVSAIINITSTALLEEHLVQKQSALATMNL